jgi:hypothetical protein
MVVDGGGGGIVPKKGKSYVSEISISSITTNYTNCTNCTSYHILPHQRTCPTHHSTHLFITRTYLQHIQPVPIPIILFLTFEFFLLPSLDQPESFVLRRVEFSSFTVSLERFVFYFIFSFFFFCGFVWW